MANTERLYYAAPSDELYQEMQDLAVQVWKSRDWHPDYLAEKLRFTEWQNYKDNFMTILAMLDQGSQRQLFKQASDGLKQAIIERMVDGGSSPNYLFTNTDNNG